MARKHPEQPRKSTPVATTPAGSRSRAGRGSLGDTQTPSAEKGEALRDGKSAEGPREEAEPDGESRGARTGAKIRTPRSEPHVKRERIFAISKLMASGEWERGVTAGHLGLEWGLAEQTVVDMACEASRLLELVVGGKGELERIYRLRLLQIAQENGHDRVPAIRVGLENLGLIQQRLRQELHIRRDLVDDMTEEEVRAFAESGELPARLQLKEAGPHAAGE